MRPLMHSRSFSADLILLANGAIATRSLGRKKFAEKYEEKPIDIMTQWRDG